MARPRRNRGILQLASGGSVTPLPPGYNPNPVTDDYNVGQASVSRTPVIIHPNEDGGNIAAHYVWNMQPSEALDTANQDYPNRYPEDVLQALHQALPQGNGTIEVYAGQSKPKVLRHEEAHALVNPYLGSLDGDPRLHELGHLAYEEIQRPRMNPLETFPEWFKPISGLSETMGYNLSHPEVVSGHGPINTTMSAPGIVQSVLDWLDKNGHSQVADQYRHLVRLQNDTDGKTIIREPNYWRANLEQDAIDSKKQQRSR